MHRANASQKPRQLVLPDVCQPLCDGELDHFVHTKETRVRCRRKTKRLTPKHFSNIMIHSQTSEEIWVSCRLERHRTAIYLKQQRRGGGGGVCFDREVCVRTHVCSRASSTSALNSLTEPGQSGSLQTFPVLKKSRTEEWIPGTIISW